MCNIILHNDLVSVALIFWINQNIPKNNTLWMYDYSSPPHTPSFRSVCATYNIP